MPDTSQVAGFELKAEISAYAVPMIVLSVILVFQKSREPQGSAKNTMRSHAMKNRLFSGIKADLR